MNRNIIPGGQVAPENHRTFLVDFSHRFATPDVTRGDTLDLYDNVSNMTCRIECMARLLAQVAFAHKQSDLGEALNAIAVDVDDIRAFVHAWGGITADEEPLLKTSKKGQDDDEAPKQTATNSPAPTDTDIAASLRRAADEYVCSGFGDVLRRKADEIEQFGLIAALDLDVSRRKVDKTEQAGRGNAEP